MVRKSSLVLAVMTAFISSYFAYEIVYIFPKVTTAVGMILNIVLVSAEILTAIFSMYLYHSVFCSMEWRHVNYKGLKSFPFVTMQIPVFNEPIRTLRETLKACRNQEYPKDRYEIIVADDSTDKKQISQIKTLCKEYGAKFIHREHRN